MISIPIGVKDALAYLALARAKATEVVATIDVLIADLIVPPDKDVDRQEDVNLALESAGTLSRHLESVQKIYESLDPEAAIVDVDALEAGE